MLTPIPQQDAGHLDQPQVVGSLLVVAYQYGPAFRQPPQCTFHHPTPDSVSHPHHRVSPRRSCGCEGRSPSVRRSPSLALCRSPCPGTGAHNKALVRWERAIRPRWGIERGLQQLEVGHVRSGYHHRKRTAIGLDQQGAFEPVFGSVGGIGAYEIPPKRALPMAPSAACHSKSTPPSSSHSSMSFSQMRSNTPSSTHLCKVRCTEESSGNSSLGSWFHWQPLRILKMIASRAWRWSMHGRPVHFGASCSSRIGSMMIHNSSGTLHIVASGFCGVEFWGISAPLLCGNSEDDTRPREF